MVFIEGIVIRSRKCQCLMGLTFIEAHVISDVTGVCSFVTQLSYRAESVCPSHLNLQRDRRDRPHFLQ